MAKTTSVYILGLITLVSARGMAQQVADSTFDASVARPAFARGTGPVVAIDEAHYNFHTKDGRYLTFALNILRWLTGILP